jgi:hypothetical protein
MAAQQGGTETDAPAAKRAASVTTRTSPVRFLAHSPQRRMSPRRRARVGPGPDAAAIAALAQTAPPATVVHFAPGAMALHTPPAHGAVPGTPPQQEEPAVGCSLEDLRAWTIAQIKGIKDDATDLEVRAAGRINVVESTADSALARTGLLETAVLELSGTVNGALNDIGIFGTIKNYVTETSLETKMAMIDHEIKLLQQHGNDFVGVLDNHLVKIEGLETEFKGHVATNFMKVEEECNNIKKALEGISNSSGTSHVNVAQRVVALELNIQKEVKTINENLGQLKMGF